MWQPSATIQKYSNGIKGEINEDLDMAGAHVRVWRMGNQERGGETNRCSRNVDISKNVTHLV